MPDIKKSAGLKITLFICACALVWALLAAAVLAMPLIDIAKALAFFALGVAAPGLAALKLLKLELTPLEALCVAWGLGYGLLVSVYFACALLAGTRYIPFAAAALCAAAIIVLALKRKEPFAKKEDGGELRTAGVFAAFAALATFAILSAAMLDPSLSGARSYFHDTMNGAGLTVSASRSFPMHILQMAGTEHRYHIFFFSYTSVFKLCTGISAFETVTKLSLITVSPFIACALTALAKRILKDDKKTALCAALTLVFPFGYFIHYLYQDVIGFPFGLGFALASVLLFFAARERSGALNRYFVLSAVFLWLCLGSKGPLAVPVLFGLCVVLLIDIITQKKLAPALTGLLFAVVFFALYYLLYANGVSDSMHVVPYYSARLTSFGSWVWGRAPEWLTDIVSVIWYCVELDALMFIAFISIIVFLCKNKKERHPFLEFTLGGISVGYVLINIFLQTGSSERYFLTAMTPFAYISGIYCLSALLASCRSKAAKWLTLGVCAASAVYGFTFAASCYMGSYNKYDMGLKGALAHSRFASADDGSLVAAMSDEERARTVTRAEYEAYLWLRDNTPEDAVIADGRYTKDRFFFSGSVFSERAFFLDGFGFVTMSDTNDNTPEKVRRDTFLRLFFRERDEGYIPLLAREGCDYLIISQYIDPGLELSDKYCELVYGNADAAIYKLDAWPEELS